MTFSRDEAMAALEVLLRGGTVPDGFELVDVRSEGPGVLVLFRWHRNRPVFGTVISWSGGVGVSTGLPVDSVDEWAFEAWLYLTEELETGYVRRALRRQKTGYIHLGEGVGERDRRYYTSSVPGDGAWLADEGWNVENARRLRDEGHLIAWLQACRDRRRSPSVVGQAVVARRSDGDAELSVLDVAAGVPEVVRRDLAREAVHEAGDDGAARITTSPAHSELLTAMGFRASGDDATWIHTNGPQINA
ncbi:hypothetical protein [Serinicoccus sp. LYQ131]|uniref:hypothetical protein n=1 Tax=Serinicoccus sp. LYQ131 TaxID=3378797 RepID=UPI0038551415